jgi:hypothetical protein
VEGGCSAVAIESGAAVRVEGRDDAGAGDAARTDQKKNTTFS